MRNECRTSIKVQGFRGMNWAAACKESAGLRDSGHKHAGSAIQLRPPRGNANSGAICYAGYF